MIYLLLYAIGWLLSVVIGLYIEGRPILVKHLVTASLLCLFWPILLPALLFVVATEIINEIICPVVGKFLTKIGNYPLIKKKNDTSKTENS